ncbi:MAG: type IV pilus assembly protein PilM [bacterium]|nr:type IV pilus assembly protein PilM [bacterium]
MDFLTLNPETFGLDISDLSIKAVQLAKKKSGFEIVSFGSAQLKEGAIRAGEIKNENTLSDAIRKALAETKGKKIKAKNVVASLPEEKAFLQVIQMPRLPEEDLKSAVIYEAENYIPLPMEEVYLDTQIILPLKNHLDHYDILIAALARKTVDSYYSCIEKAGLKPRVLEIESLAIARALAKDGVAKSPLLLIDLGATKTSFIVFSGTAVRFTSSIPVSSQKLTEAIARTLKIDLAEAEKIKIEYGLEAITRKKSGEIFDALIPPLTDLVEQIKKHLSFYRDHSSHEHLSPNGAVIEKILLCGGGANLKGLPDFLSSELGLPVELGNPLINILPEDKKAISSLSFEASLSYATALGLALRNFQEE